MFNGIIECLGEIIEIINNGSNKTFWLKSPISTELKIDESVSHDGVCLTIEDIRDGCHKVTAIKETLDKTNFRERKVGDILNLERSLLMNGRIHGHIVQGHIDTTAVCIGKKELEGSKEFTFRYKKSFAHLIIDKGSICVNGISLTAFKVGKKKFTVAIIPYTLVNTNVDKIEKGSSINLEFDILGKYIKRMTGWRKK